MATTKIWAIKDSISRVVSYVENREKTTNENETTMFVTGVNCNRDTALAEMIRTQI